MGVRLVPDTGLIGLEIIRSAQVEDARVTFGPGRWYRRKLRYGARRTPRLRLSEFHRRLDPSPAATVTVRARPRERRASARRATRAGPSRRSEPDEPDDIDAGRRAG